MDSPSQNAWSDSTQELSKILSHMLLRLGEGRGIESPRYEVPAHFESPSRSLTHQRRLMFTGLPANLQVRSVRFSEVRLGSVGHEVVTLGPSQGSPSCAGGRGVRKAAAPFGSLDARKVFKNFLEKSLNLFIDDSCVLRAVTP